VNTGTGRNLSKKVVVAQTVGFGYPTRGRAVR
jgi:hypothetical protein